MEKQSASPPFSAIRRDEGPLTMSMVPDSDLHLDLEKRARKETAYPQQNANQQ